MTAPIERRGENRPLENRVPAAAPIPLVLDSPHSGREFPADFYAAVFRPPRAYLRNLPQSSSSRA